jgi:hypothetical protein
MKWTNPIANLVARKKSALHQQLQLLIPTAETVANASFLSLLKDQRFSRQMAALAKDVKSWDFFVTTACVNAALLGLALDKQSDAVGPMVVQKVDEWNADAPRFLSDCGKFLASSFGSIPFERESSAFQERFRDGTGMWVLWNLYGRAPTFDECELVSCPSGS